MPYLYLKTNIKVKNKQHYVLLFVRGDIWNAEKKANEYIQKHNLDPLAGGYNTKKTGKLLWKNHHIINIYDKDAINKYKQFIAELIAQEV